MRNNHHAVSRKRHGTDIVMLIVMAALLVIFAMEIPFRDESAAYSGQTAGVPLITELMPSNKGAVTTEAGMYCDWIELCNTTDRSVNLAGFALTDNPKMPTKYVLPYWVLGPGEFVIVYADGGESTDTELHAPFKLKSSSEQILLVDTDGAELQQVNYPALTSDQSYSLDITTMEWAPSDAYTPGYPNTEEGYTACQRDRRAESPVTLNEVMAGNTITFRDQDGDYSDWVELYNTSDETIDLTGWGLSNTEARPKSWEFPETQIGPGEYRIVFLSGKNRSVSGEELHTNFKASNYSESIYLANLRGQIVSEVHIDDLKEDLSYALIPDTGRWQVFSQPTPGYPNTENGWNAFQEILYTDGDSPVVINEVMSGNTKTLQDQYGEYPDFIELLNRSDQDVDLSGWALTDNTEELGRWHFPVLTLAPGEYLTVYASGRDSVLSKKKSHADFSLSSEGDITVLTDADGRVADRCYVPRLRADVSYQRQAGSLVFSYCDHPTPGAANEDGYPGIAAAPSCSVMAGMYDDAQQVALSAEPGARIYYTLDGTVPTEGSAPYAGPIPVETTTAIRAIAYRDGYMPSDVACATYLIGENIDIPVVSIVTDPANLFDEKTGIYADGPGWTPQRPHYGANYWQDWERPAHVELLEPDGIVGISQDIGIKIFGGLSRIREEKSFSLMSRAEYGNDTFDYPVFPELSFTSYKNLIVRSAQDANMTHIRDQLQVELALETADVDGQAHRQCILFINGEFWGIYDIMEKINEHFIAQHHDVNPDKIDLLVHNGDVILGSNEDYLALIEYVKTHDLSVQENYDYVASQIDIDNYIDWCAVEMYIANEDLDNIKMWRTQESGGKWRWILYDLDWGFYNLNQEQYAERLDVFSTFLNPEGCGNSNHTDNSLIRGLLANEGFKQKFMERFVYHCTVTFDPKKVLARIDELAANIEPYMQRDLDKWQNGNMEAWRDVHLKLLRDYAEQRPAINLHYMQQYFGLTDTQMDQLLAHTQ